MTPAEIARMFSRVSSRYDLANRVLSLGLDQGWRRCLVSWSAPPPNARVLDLCTGTADLLIEYARRAEKPLLWGLDLSYEMLAVARRKLQAKRSIHSALLIRGDALKLPFPSEAFDLVTIAFGLRNLKSIPKGLEEMARVLKPKGRLFILEFSLPAGPLFRLIYLGYLKRCVPRLGGLITGDRRAYEYLARSILEFPSPEEVLAQMKDAGLEKLGRLPLSGEIATIFCGERP